LNVWMAAANGREAALVLRNVRRLSMRSIIADYRLPYEQERRNRQHPCSLAHLLLEGNSVIVLPRHLRKSSVDAG